MSTLYYETYWHRRFGQAILPKEVEHMLREGRLEREDQVLREDGDDAVMLSRFWLKDPEVSSD